MMIIKLFIPGDFEDAYLYMGWLHILTRSRSIRLYNLEDIADKIDSYLPDSSPFVTILFARNDWLHSRLFKSLVKNKRILNYFKQIIGKLSPQIEFNRNLIGGLYERDLPINTDIVFDWRYYNRRLFVGTDDGLYNIGFDWDEMLVEPSPQKRLEPQCISISTRFSTVNASCGNEGFFTSVNEFGPISGSTSRSFTQVADQSLRSSWMLYDIVNYQSNTLASIFKTRREKRDDGNGHGGYYITDIEDIPFSLEFLFQHLRDTYHIDESSIQYMFNSRRNIFIHTFEGNFFALGLPRDPRYQPLTFTRTYKGKGTRILSASPTRAGIVFETDDNVFLFANNEWIRLLESPVLTVRSYITSKRYQNMITITTEEGVFIISLFDEKSL